MPGLATDGVVAEATGEFALGAVDLAVQVVAFHVADQLPVEVQLVQVAAAVIQVVQVLAGGKGQRGQVAERIVVVGQRALGRGFFRQAAEDVVGKFQLFSRDAEFSAAVSRLALDGQQAVAVVVREILTGVVVESGQQTANRIALEIRAALWPFAFFAVAGFFNLSQMPAQVVTETAGQLVDAFFFDQPVGMVVGESVGRIVFIGQCHQAQGLVVLVRDHQPLGVLAADRQATGVACQVGGLALTVGVREHLAVGVVGKAFAAAVRVIDAQHFAAGFAFQRGGVVQGIGDGDQLMAFVVSVMGTFARAVLKAFDLRQAVPPQVF
ncbi:hypothetical protein PSTA9_03783 [Pseudomonas syringae pv. tomato]|nr:hypothetical protein PSTA9_03783 [Pseudomonas syringae pv. tomato]